MKARFEVVWTDDGWQTMHKTAAEPGQRGIQRGYYRAGRAARKWNGRCTGQNWERD